METIIDKYLWTSDQDVGDMPEELYATLQIHKPPHLTHSELNRMVDVFCFRTLPSRTGLASLASWLGLITGHGTEQFHDAERHPSRVIEQLSDIAKGHEYLMNSTHPVQIQTSPNTSIRIDYESSRWEGIGGVYFWTDNPQSDLPLYVMRGNPTLKDQKLRFDIRTVQPWIANDIFLYNLKKDKFWERMQRDGVSPDNIHNAQTAIRQRQRIIDRFENTLEHEENIFQNAMKLSSEEIFLMIGTAYLQGSGVQELRGIEHSHHPESKKIKNMNYNQLFVRQFDYDLTEEQYPWKLENHGSNFAINNLNILPPTLKRMLIDTYETAAERP